MDVIDKKTTRELLSSLLGELAKSSSEIKTAKEDLIKANNRMRFCLLLVNSLIDRKDV